MKEKVIKEIRKVIQEGIDVNVEGFKIINNNKSMFTQNDFKQTKEGKPRYSKLDKYGRSKGAIALISKYTIALVMEKSIKYDNPSNWTKIHHPKINKTSIFERCHIVGYSLSARLCNKKNMFIGTNHLNTGTMEDFERNIKKFIEEHKNSKIFFI